ncbi:MAG: HNH endonuclease signature motif containing protein [Ignavibacteria bacterium]|jgi:hypothetical protein
MNKKRKNIPPKIKSELLKEFNHKCAICGTDKPHIHHIDENPSNNDINNLIPLCPNCHLKDQHNPTDSIPYYKLKLFREYKDPTILCSKFHPLYARMVYLFDINEGSEDQGLIDRTEELIKFISFLNMGGFYKDEISKLIRSGVRNYSSGSPTLTRMRYETEYREKLLNNRNRVFQLIVESLRYQNWIEAKT